MKFFETSRKLNYLRLNKNVGLGKLKLGDLKLGRDLYQKRFFLIAETFCLGVFLFMVSCTGAPSEEKPSTEVSVLGCPSNIVEVIAGSGDTLIVSWTEPSAEDSDGTVITILAQSHSSGDAFDIGLTEVLYTFTAVDGLSSVCSFIVTVSEAASTGVTIVDDCPSDIMEDAAAGATSVAVTWTEPSAEDSDGTVITLLEQSHNSGDTFNVGTTGVAYTFTDNAANTAECTFTVLVRAGKIYSFHLADNNTEPSELNPFLIETKEDLEMLGTVVNNEAIFNINGTDVSYGVSSYRLENSFDLSGYNYMPIGDCRDDMGGLPSPCGDSDDIAFKGNFDGNGQTLTNLSYNGSEAAMGFFSVISNATISDFTLRNFFLTNTSIDVSHATGALVGFVDENSVITDVIVFGGIIEGKDNVGGLVGHQFNGAITTSLVTGVVLGRSNVGGLVGLQAGGSIMSSTVSGSVTGAKYNIGGFIGLQTGGSIMSSAAIGPVTGTGSEYSALNIGGFVGVQINGSITASYATGTVTGPGFAVGGFVGRQETGSIARSYATGFLVVQENLIFIGGFAGYRYTAANLTSCYWDLTTTGQAASSNDICTGKTTAALQVVGGAGSIYATWNSPPWIFAAGEYPALVQ